MEAGSPSTRSTSPRRASPIAPLAAAALAAAAWLIAAPPVADLAAHEYRAWLWDAEGFTVWNAQWYGGHHVPGYSLLFPPLGGLLGAPAAVALAGVASAAALVALARDAAPADRRELAGWIAAAGAAANLVAGRGPFALGIAFAALALLLARRGRSGWAAAASLAAVWSSPVAGLFLALAGAAWWLAKRPPAAAAVTLPAVGGGLLLAGLFPEGGEERFVATAFWPMLAVCAAATALLRDRTLRLAALAYLALLVAAFLLPTPVGQNALRLGVLAGPALLAVAGVGPRAALLLVGAALLYLQWLPAVRAVGESRGDPATAASFHAPLLDFLVRAAAPGDRVEVVFTRGHWEATHVAKHWALARGWERQLDLEVNRLFYSDGLTPDRYEAWLRHEAIRWVALPDAPLDFSAREEARIVASGPAFLRPAALTGGWRVYEVRGVEPARAIAAAGPSSLAVREAAVLPGRRHTRYFGDCARETEEGWVAVDRGVELAARLRDGGCPR